MNVRTTTCLMVGLLLAVLSGGTAAAEVYWVTAVAKAPGDEGTLWRSELDLLNDTCGELATVTLTIWPQGVATNRVVQVPSGYLLVYEDVMAQPFGLQSYNGPLRVTSDRPLAVTSRTFNQGQFGTFGQSVDAVTPVDGFRQDQGALLPRCFENDGFRTNVLLLNMGSTPARVRLTLRDLQDVVGEFDVDLAPGQMRQENRVFANHGSHPSVDAGWVRAQVMFGESVWALASVIDNATGDPTTVLPVLSDCEPSSSLQADFTWDPPQASGEDFQVQFRDLSTGAVTWAWDFDNGNSSTQENPTQVFSPGTYQVSLTVTDGSGGSDTAVKTLALGGGEAPVAAFTWSPTTPLANEVVTFTDQSTGSPTSWDWDFGGGQTSTSQSPTHAFAAAATYPVTLVASNAAGSSAPSQRNVTVVPRPTVDFTWSPQSPGVGASVTFTNQSSNVPTGWTRQWLFGDGSSSTQASPTHSYSSADTFAVRLSYFDPADASRTATATKNLTVVASLEADFVWSPAVAVVNEQLRFYDRSSGHPTQWLWDFGDGTTSAEELPAKTYLTHGTRTVTLTVSGAGVAPDTTSKQVEVLALYADFATRPITPAFGDEITFLDLTRGDPTHWTWRFGDGEVLSGDSSNPSIRAPKHTYAGTGPYEVTLDVTNALGSSTATHTVAFVPQASFTRIPEGEVSVGQPVQFTDTSTQDPIRWSWDFGDDPEAGPETTQQPRHTFTQAGVYTVSLSAFNTIGSGWVAAEVEVRGSCQPPAAPQIEPLNPVAADCPYAVRWTPTSPFDAYELQESTDSAFASVTSYQPDGTEQELSHPGANGVYYYRVRAVEGRHCAAASAWSGWSAAVAVQVGGPLGRCQIRRFALPGDGGDLDLVWVDGGSFQMGSPEDERGRLTNETRHQVILSQGYYIGRHEVTQAQWHAVTGLNPSLFTECGGDCPVEGLTFSAICGLGSDCGAVSGFLYQLNQALGLTGASERLRLPTEAEWELAARAGSTDRYSHGDVLECDDRCGGCPDHDRHLWWCKNSLDGTRAVGRKNPNPLGLYDAHGGVEEWVLDLYGDYPTGVVTDPAGAESGTTRLARGGAWVYFGSTARAAFRSTKDSSNYSPALGLRLVYGPPAPEPTTAAGWPEEKAAAPPTLDPAVMGLELPSALQNRIERWRLSREASAE